MSHLIPSFTRLLDPFRPCFRAETFFVFGHTLVAWLLCLGRRTLSEVWQASTLHPARHHDALYHFFATARWDPHDVGLRLALRLVARFAPTGRIWLVVDDTLCHKRGNHIAFGGIYLDAVLSSKRRKVFRYGINQVVLGLAVRLPGRPDRCFCLPLLVQPLRKKGSPGYVKRTTLAAQMAAHIAALFPERSLCLVGDTAYINKTTLRDRPANLHVLGPISPKAVLHQPPRPRQRGQMGRPCRKGPRLPTPREMVAATERFPATVADYAFPGGARALRTQDVTDVLWYAASQQQRQRLVLIHDPKGEWRDLALLGTDATMPVAEVIEGYCRRWSIELTFHDSKQYLGLSDPQVRTEASVERAHTMAYWCYSLTILWYAEQQGQATPLQRQRPWYKPPAQPTFTDMLGTLRLALWQGRIFGVTGPTTPASANDEILQTLLHFIAAVR